MVPSLGKKRGAVSSSTEGSGGNDGIVLPMQLVGSGMYQVAYTIPVQIGGSKSFSLQVDTGSSDLWVASSSCSTSSCDAVGGGNLYNPSSGTQTGVNFNITYLRGGVAGPIVWDRVEVGGYVIDNQALASATVVNQEPLSSDFSGILGLALPLNSIIASLIPPVTDNSPDGAAWASNLFSLTPTSAAPASRFLSLSLSRPGSDRIPSLLGIGHHPSSIVSDPSQVLYSSLVSEKEGTLYWKCSVKAITVYVDGTAKPINIGGSNTGDSYPSAVLDSGIPFILVTSTVANAIYGALDIGPGSDGQYYVPCKTPLNMTFTLDDRPEIPLHPLDVTSEPDDNNQAQYCVGMIQVADAWLSSASAGIGDMVLGVPFLRNTYTVMAYTTPNANGTFPDLSTSSPSDVVRPRLGLLGLTEPTVALEEFHTVRSLNQPMSSLNHTHSPQASDTGSRKISIGIIVLLALVGFFSLCCILFGLRWFLLKRKYKAADGLEGGGGGVAGGASNDVSDGGNKTVLRNLGNNGTSEKKSLPYTPLGKSSFEDVWLEEATTRDSGDTSGSRGAVPFPAAKSFASDYTISSSQTRVEDIGEFGHIGKDSLDIKWSTTDDILLRRGTWLHHDSSAGSGGGGANIGGGGGGAGDNNLNNTLQSHLRHERGRSMSAPLLRHQHSHSDSFDSDKGGSGAPAVPGTFYPGVASNDGGGMDTANDSPEPPNGKTDLGEFGYRFPVTHPPSDDGGGNRLPRRAVRSSMAGIGSAARRRRKFEQFEPLSFPLDFNIATSTTGAGAEADNNWWPGYPPSVSKKPSSPHRTEGELVVQFSSSPPSSPPPPPPPPGAAASDYHRPPLPPLPDEFDPYREFSSGS